MKVEIVLDPAKAQPAPTLSQRVGPAPATATSTITTQGCVLILLVCFDHIIKSTFQCDPRNKGRQGSPQEKGSEKTTKDRRGFGCRDGCT